MKKTLKAILGIKKLLTIRTQKKKIFLFSESKNYRNNFLPLIKSLKTHTNYNIYYFSSDYDDIDKIDEDLEPIYIGDGFLLILFFQLIKCDMMIMTLSNLGENQIKKVKSCKKYVYFFHSYCSTHKLYEKFAFKNYDIILAVGDFQIKELKKAEEIYNLPRKKIFKVGFFYYEKLNSLKNLKKKKENNIIYAPSWSRNKKNLFNDYSIEIISTLINFNFSVTLRTHPETLKREKKILLQIKKEFSNSPKFNLNLDLNDISGFEESEMLITDNGGVGLEYGLIYEKPTLYINYEEKIHNLNYKDLDMEPFEDKFKRKFGYQVNISELNQLNKKIKEIKEKFNYQNSGIQDFFTNNGLKTNNASNTATNIIKEILQ